MRVQLSFTTVPDARRRLLRTKFCGSCGQLLLRNQEDARNYIGLLLRHPVLKPGTFALEPYPCPHRKGWHAGRNPNTLALDFKAGRVTRKTETTHAE
jgi:hypothetical protein